MLSKLVPNLFHPQNWRQIGRELRVTWNLVRDSRVPIYAKAIPAVVMLYLLFPIDLVPDVIPILGQLDDLVLLMLALRLFVRMAPRDVVAEHERSLQTNMRLLS